MAKFKVGDHIYSIMYIFEILEHLHVDTYRYVAKYDEHWNALGSGHTPDVAVFGDNYKVVHTPSPEPLVNEQAKILLNMAISSMVIDINVAQFVDCAMDYARSTRPQECKPLDPTKSGWHWINVNTFVVPKWWDAKIQKWHTKNNNSARGRLTSVEASWSGWKYDKPCEY